MSVTLVDNVARPLATALSLAFSEDTYGKLDGYGILGAAADPDAAIKALFANSEQGLWYDYSDLATMFQDRTGTTPVTADGQTVGLILDKSKGLVLGSELITNGTFDSDTTGWTAQWSSLSVVSGAARITNTSDYGYMYRGSGATTVENKWYEISFDLIAKTVQYLTARIGTYPLAEDLAPKLVLSATGSNKLIFMATTTTSFLSFQNWSGVGDYSDVDNVSIKEIAANPAIAPSDAARPAKTSTGTADWINYDDVDDVLNSTFPSSLGSSCTVCRANVGAAPTILTAQTIGTNYADSTDNAALIIINRALTGQETTDITAWLTAKGATS